MKKTISLIAVFLSVSGFSTTATQTIIDVGGQPVLDVGVLGPKTFAVRPNGTDYRFGVSDTSMQMHYDNIVVGKDVYGTAGGAGGSITFKLRNPGSWDVPIGNIGYPSSAPYDMVFNSGSALAPAAGWKFSTMDGAGNDVFRMNIQGGSPNSIVEFTTNLQLGRSTLLNPLSIGRVVSLYDPATSGVVLGILGRTWTVAAITGYSNSLGFYNGSSYNAMMFASGRTGISATSDDGIHALQVGGKITQSGNALNIATSQTPTSSSAACRTGDMAWDSNYVYVCVSTNTWKRTNLATW